MIISSNIFSAGVQIDGRRTVTELHIDQFGKEHHVNYMADIGVDINSVMTGRVASINEQIIENELNEIVSKNDVENYTPVYANEKQMRKFVLQHFLTNEAENVFNLISYIEQLTDIQISEEVGSEKVSKIRARTQNLKSIKTDLDDDQGQVEEEN